MASSTDYPVGVIGGSGLYAMDGLEVHEERRVETPFGEPSDPYVLGEIDGHRVAFLARHGKGHRLMPTELNYRANIFGFKLLGCRRILAISAVGSMKVEYEPTHIVIPDQFIDRTRHRADTFFGNGLVAHVSIADPVCPVLAEAAYQAGVAAGAKIHKGGTYVCMEGPQFSTRAESNVYRSWGVDVIGMTNYQEARLAREAEICYSTVAMVTDYDCWHESEEDVNVEAVLGYLRQNAATAQDLIRRVVTSEIPDEGCGCASALAMALITDPEVVPEKTKRDLSAIISKYIGCTETKDGEE